MKNQPSLDWLQRVKMTRIILHWSAGAWKASDLDSEQYHFIVENAVNVVRGDHSLADNANTSDGDYPAIPGAAIPARLVFPWLAWRARSKARSTPADFR